jgi:sulfur-oxidizing protein SoxA
MKRLITIVLSTALAGLGCSAWAGPEEDRQAFENYFTKKYPDTPLDDFINGVYSIDEASREQWMEIEEFPPYEIAMDEGAAMYETPFANGKGYSDCFGDGAGVRAKYPYFDTDRGEIITMELAINECRTANGEEPLKYSKGKMASISAYMSFLSRGETINVEIPDDPRALQAYENGKEFYYRKRGQLNFSCFDCHGSGSGAYVRADLLSPALGHVSHFPVYRSKWNSMGTLHRRFGGCNRQVRAASFKSQSTIYRELEYFLTYMSNGLEFNGPGARK